MYSSRPLLIPLALFFSSFGPLQLHKKGTNDRRGVRAVFQDLIYKAIRSVGNRSLAPTVAASGECVLWRTHVCTKNISSPETEQRQRSWKTRSEYVDAYACFWHPVSTRSSLVRLRLIRRGTDATTDIISVATHKTVTRVARHECDIKAFARA